MRQSNLIAGIALGLAVATPPPAVAQTPTYSAEIRRTEYGIPHVQAADWGSLGYGYGYAYAQDNYCVAMRGIVSATSRSAELLGEDGGDIVSDFVLRYVFGTKADFARDHLPATDTPSYQLSAGFAAGMNRYLRETGVAKLSTGEDGCRDADWVYAIDATDVAMLNARVALWGSSDQSLVRYAIFAASVPESATGAAGPAPRAAPSPTAATGLSAAQWHALAKDLRRLHGALGDTSGGSNAVAVGRDLSQTDAGLLLGNPHQPWRGHRSFYQAHLTIPGEYDVAGAALQGMPFIGIGFNKDVAWTHTVSFASRFSLYELQLEPGNRQRYRYDGAYRSMTAQEVAIDVKLDDGSLETRRRTFYRSHFGPLVELGGVNPLLGGWPLYSGTVFAIRDAVAGRYATMMDQYLRMGQASDMDEFTAALHTIGIPVFHTLAADRAGEAFYGEVASVPHVTPAQLETCTTGTLRQAIAVETRNAVIALDGSTSACEWGRDSDSPADSNIYGYSSRPKVRTTRYVANSNDSYWLSDADNPLTGFPVVFGWLGHEEQQQLLRTRIGHQMIAERVAATDGLDENVGFTLASLKAMLFRNRVYAAEIVLDDVLAICADTVTIAIVDSEGGRALRACRVLEAWDRKVELDSLGAQVFKEFWAALHRELGDLYSDEIINDDFWLQDFDPADPLNTPQGVDSVVKPETPLQRLLRLLLGAEPPPSNRDLVIASLSDAVEALNAAGVALDAPWGEVQFDARLAHTEDGTDDDTADREDATEPADPVRIPIHGGDGSMGVYGAISSSLREGGYSLIGSGNSYMQAVTWDDTDCPVADTLLAPSQSSDPASAHFRDQTELYSRKQWVRFPFCADQIEAAQIGETLVVEAP